LTYDYADASGSSSDTGNGNGGLGEGTDLGVNGGETRCLCGAVNCRGWIPFDPDVD
jgi:hypothetical protein